jgi:uncharacterized membrane protein HdeD (DUF308 family)
MSASLAANRAAPDAPPLRDVLRSIAIARAVLALVWAAGLVIAVSDEVPSMGSDVPVAAAALLASYPAIDVVASLVEALGSDAFGRLVRINAAISAVAVAAIGATAFAADAGATLVAFGVWAAVSGVIQLAVAVHRQRAAGRQLQMIVSGGLSTIAGIGFLAASGNDDARLASVGGYMALGALLYLLWARGRTARERPRSRRTGRTPQEMQNHVYSLTLPAWRARFAGRAATVSARPRSDRSLPHVMTPRIER